MVPGIFLYMFNVLMGYGDASIVGPFLLAPLGYIAAVTMGIPAYLIMRKRNICSFPAYLLLGAVIGFVFYLLFTILTSYPGQTLAVLQHSRGPLLVAPAYSALAAAVFWAIAIRRHQFPTSA
jgi:hypothetical protein